MGVGGSDRIGACIVHAGMNCERCGIDGQITFDDIAVMVDPNQVGDLDLAEVDAERVYPKRVGEFRVACGNVTGYAFIKAEF